MAVAFDAVGPSSAGTSATTATSLSWLHVCTGNAGLLVVGITLAGPDPGLTLSVTYNSVAMNSAGLVHSGGGVSGYVQLFYLAGPATGSNTVAVTVTGGTASWLIGGSVSFTGVNSLNPIRNFTSSTTSSVNVSSAVDNMVVDAICTGSGITSSNQTQKWLKNLNGSSAAGNSAQSIASGASSVTMSYVITPDSVGLIAMDIVSIPAIAGYSASYQAKLVPAV